jgi:hypothetical protein
VFDMTLWTITLPMIVATTPVSGLADNPAATRLEREGWSVGGEVIPFPAPILAQGATPEQERAALKTIAGSERAVSDLTRDSVAAPYVLKTQDVPLGGTAIVRKADLWFVVRARLDQINPGA